LLDIWKSPCGFRSEIYIRRKHGKSFPDMQGPTVREGLVQLFDRTWIDRIWTLQEVALTPNPWILCGTGSLGWRTLLYATAYFDWVDRQFIIPGLPHNVCDRWRAVLCLWLSIHSASGAGPKEFPEKPVWEETTENYVEFLQTVFYNTGYFDTLNLWTTLLICASCAGAVVALSLSSYLSKNFTAWLALTVFFSICPIAILVLANYTSSVILPLPRRRVTRDLIVREPMTDDGAVVQGILRRKCTDPKDKSYGTHGIMAKLGIPLNPPKISATKEALYKDLLLATLVKTRNLNLILCASGSVQGQPS
jgi:hypothetical protein